MSFALRAMTRIPEFAAVQWRYNVLARFRSAAFPPRVVEWIVTHRCNARCVMCGLWREPAPAAEDLSPDDIGHILRDRLFERVQYIGINGGEPFMRRDLDDIVSRMLNVRTGLKRLSLATNGLLTDRIEPGIASIAESCRRNGTLLSVGVSMHGRGDTLARIYGVADAESRIQDTLDALLAMRKRNRLSVSVNCVLLKENIGSAGTLASWAAGKKLPISFVIGERRHRFRNRTSESLAEGEDREAFSRFFDRLSRDRRVSPFLRIRYGEVADVTRGRGRRRLSCHYRFAGVMIEPDGALYPCPRSEPLGNARTASAWDLYYNPRSVAYMKERLDREECPVCPPYTLTRLEVEKDLLTLLYRCVRPRSFAHERD